jgi:hypothetical protein
LVAMRDPFRPSFGVSPPLLVGRQELIEDLGDALDTGPGGLARATLYTGQRGTGKTVLLNAVEDEAKSRGWVVISETATPGFVKRITDEQLPALLAQHDPRSVRRHLTGVTIGKAGVSWTAEDIHRAVPGLRNQLFLLADLLADNQTGVLVSIDEIHREARREIEELTATVQHAFREEREVAFVAAGLPSAVSDLLNDPLLTFLRRADRHALTTVDADDVRRALNEPITQAGRNVSDDVLDVMVKGTAGYPFLIQLVGSSVWRIHPDDLQITLDDARRGVEAAHRRMGALVHEPSLAGASAIDRSFLVAMAKDDGPSRMADIKVRINADDNFASQYRLRLIAQELIVAAGHGRVDFALPYLREYLRDHATFAV